MTINPHVGAFRRVVEALEGPARVFRTVLDVPVGIPVICVELPLRDGSLFEVLPGDVELVDERAAATTVSSGAAAIPLSPATPSARASIPATPARGEPLAPVFSFRRASAKGAPPAAAPVSSSQQNAGFAEPRSGGVETHLPPGVSARLSPSDLPAAPRGAEAARAPIAGNTAAGKSGLVTALPAVSKQQSVAEFPDLERSLGEIGRLADALIHAAQPGAARFAPPPAAGRDTALPSAPPAAPNHLPADAAFTPGSQRAPLAVTPESSAARATYAQASTSSTVVSRPSFASAPFPDPDPEWLAEVINEVLAEQARRHGVDLS